MGHLDLDKPFVALGSRLQRIRGDLVVDGRPISQGAMAHKLEDCDPQGVSVSQSRISRWESGKERPNKHTLIAYAKLADEDPAELLRLAGYGFVEEASPRSDQVPASSRGRARRWLAVSATALAFIAAVLLGVSSLRQAAPTRAEVVDGGRLDVYHEDLLLWSHRLGHDLRQAVEPLVVDLDADGSEEILVSIDPALPPNRTGHLVALTDRGEELWRFTYGRAISVGHRHFTPYFVGHQLAWVDETPTPYVVVVILHNQWFPTQVVLLEPTTGRLVAEYWHPGYIEDLEVFDVGDDGTFELLLSGINNPGDGPGRASLAVLDLPFRATREPDVVFGLVHSQERAYLLFPRLDLQDARTALAIARQVYAESESQFAVAIDSGTHDLVLYHFDRELELVDMRVSDSFVRQHDAALDHRYRPGEWEAWKRVQRFDRVPNANRLGGAGPTESAAASTVK